ncbi:hypothetical protein WG909_05900 [Peptostreptococcaceae bacterium AGR-M142]
MISTAKNTSDFAYLNNIVKNNTKFNIDNIKGINSQNVFEVLAQKYDVRYASAKEFDEIAQNLLKAEKISELDYLLMTFDNKKNLNSDKKTNWIEQLRISAQNSLSVGDKNFYDMKIKQINILKEIENYN